ncbi:MAG: hypothetical protein MOGMAGMI_00213 [Candidatus Omnitrophica bacterium]|nr:hypothetical protein [Candidatus Omnitrophota bacterium]
MSVLHEAVKRAADTRRAPETTSVPVPPAPRTATRTTRLRPYLTAAAVVLALAALVWIYAAQSRQDRALAALHVRLDTVSTEISRAQDGRARTDGQLAALQREVSQLRQIFGEQSEQTERTELSVRSLQTGVRNAEGRLARLESSLAATKDRLDEMTERLPEETPVSDGAGFLPAA